MRMWMVDPKVLCDQHLLGEHGELHKFLPTWVKKQRIDRRITDNAMEPKSYKVRHDLIADEMSFRGMNHKSPLEQPDFSYLPPEYLTHQVDIEDNLRRLHLRCKTCLERWKIIKGVPVL